MYSSSGNISSEWETTISIKSSESEYARAKQTEKYSMDIIFLFKNGLRVSNRTVQRKIKVNDRKLLTFYKNAWVPMDRTISTEESVDLPEIMSVEKCIVRLIVFWDDGIRITYNKEICEFGEKYNIEYEIEYPENSEYQYILLEERRLIKCFLEKQHTIKRNIMSRLDMFSCVMSKVQMWHCFDDTQSYIWAYKWNGIKAKILITDTQQEDGSFIAYEWSDASSITNKMCRGSNIRDIVNICFAVEIMDDRIIIIEAIGSSMNDAIYTTEPMGNASILKHLNVGDMYIGEKPVSIQKFYPPSLPNTYGPDCDGFIIIQNDLIIKWKIPTIDVKCITPYTFKVGSQIIPLSFVGEPGSIYEITYKNEVLRKRNDRIAASSDQEYAVFLESKALLE